VAADLQGKFYLCEIYKSNTTQALQLLEFLIKNGSERVIDDARAHTSLLKMLRQFHFIDANGKDQGINVRNRSKELVDLLSDVDKIRTERKKAKGNRAKYGGYEGSGAGGSGGDSSSSGRYGGFGSESAGYGAYDGRVYGDGGGFGGQTSEYQDSQGRRDQFEEYDEFEEAAPAGKSRRKASTSSPTSKRESKKPEPKAKVPEEDLFDFGDEPATVSTSKQSGSALGSLQPADDEDDFDDFQSAPVQPSSGKVGIPPPISAGTTSSPFSAPSGAFSTMSPTTSTNLASPTTGTILSPGPSPAPSRAPQQPTAYQPAQPNYFTSVQTGAGQPAPAAGRPAVSTTPGGLGKPVGSAAPARAAAAGGDAFAGLLAGTPAAKRDAGAGGAKLTMADLARQKTSAGIWGASAAAAPGGAAAAPKGQQKTGGGLDDLLGL
jgi:epsin